MTQDSIRNNKGGKSDVLLVRDWALALGLVHNRRIYTPATRLEKDIYDGEH